MKMIQGWGGERLTLHFVQIPCCLAEHYSSSLRKEDKQETEEKNIFSATLGKIQLEEQPAAYLDVAPELQHTTHG